MPRAASNGRAGAKAVPRDQAILAAAAELFQARGFAAVGVDEIGKSAGASGPTIYRFFAGKDDILAALFDEGLDDLFRRTGGTFEDPEVELRHLATRHAEFIIENPLLASVCLLEGRSLTATHRRRFQRRSKAYNERWADVLMRCFPGTPDTHVEVAVHSAIGALNATLTWPKSLRTADSVEYLVNQVLAGVSSLARATADR